MAFNRDKLKNRRLELGLTLEQVANYIGVEKPTVQRYESGKIKKIDTVTVEKLAHALKCSPAYLMDWPDAEKPESFSNDVSDDIDSVLEKLEAQPEGLMFCGKPMDDETKRLLKLSLEHVKRLATEMDKAEGK